VVLGRAVGDQVHLVLMAFEALGDGAMERWASIRAQRPGMVQERGLERTNGRKSVQISHQMRAKPYSLRDVPGLF